MNPGPVPRLVCLLTCLALMLGGQGGAWARRSKHHHSSSEAKRSKRHLAEGRYHLKKANALAGDDHCEAAVREYTKAYEKLQDPVVLFNRASCYRSLGEDGKAAADLRAFLKGMPSAPNRADIEARIAALEKPAARPEPKAKPKPDEPVATAAEPPAHERPRIKMDEPAPPRPQPPPPAPPPPQAAAPPPAPPPVPRAEPEVTPEAPAVLVAEAPPRATKQRQPKSLWWVWVTLGVLVAGGATAGILLLRPEGQTIPATDLGNYRF